MEPTTKQRERTVVWVRRQFHQRETAAYDLTAIEGWHQSDTSGGTHQKANRHYWHGYVWCNAMLEGSVAHSCEHGPPPHRIKVCITKTRNEEAWPAILRVAEITVAERMLRRSKQCVPDRPRIPRKVMDHVIARKFTRRMTSNQRRLEFFRSVDRAKLQEAWDRYVASLKVTPTGAEHLQAIFTAEIDALFATGPVTTELPARGAKRREAKRAMIEAAAKLAKREAERMKRRAAAGRVATEAGPR
jgi:hypothetical protein